MLDPGAVGVTEEELGPLPDRIITDPRAAWVDPRGWFPDAGRPLELEIGSGKGSFLLQEASERPGVNFLGIEWAREFYEYTADRIRRRGLQNVRVLRADATEFLHWRCPDGVAQVMHLYFSDPWPKSRHHRRRVVQDRFLADAARVLAAGGELRIVTDHEEYWAWMEQHFVRWAEPAGGEAAGHRPFLREPFERPGSAGSGELVGTNFERKYRREGRPFFATVLRKAAISGPLGSPGVGPGR
jgi:tRNA (guanine-N7-)-methyltransferase